MTFSFRSLAVSTLICLASPTVARAQDASIPSVQSLDDGLLTIMKGGKTLGLAGRVARIGPVIDRVYDIPLMTRLAVGAAWPTIAPSDQMALVTAFRRMTIAQYASNFDGFSSQSFSVDPKVEARGSDKLVRTTLNNPKGASVAIAYRLRQSGGSWKVIDVFYRNSISQLATKRSDFASTLQSGGAKALIAHLNALSAKAGG